MLHRVMQKLWTDQRGQATLEYALFLAAIALPSMILFRRLLQVLGDLFAFTTLMLSLPFI